MCFGSQWLHLCVLSMLWLVRVDVSRLTFAFCSFFTSFFCHVHSYYLLPVTQDGLSKLHTWSGLWSWERIKCEAADLQGAGPSVTPRKLPLLSALLLLCGALLRLLVNVAGIRYCHLVVECRLNYFRKTTSRSSSAWKYIF